MMQASDGKRYQARQDRSQAILDKLFQKAKKINAPPKSSLGIAITYLKNNEQELRNYTPQLHKFHKKTNNVHT